MKPSIPQGTRDFSPADVRRRQYILQTIRNVFELYGYQPLETPSMENLSTLMGKYGDEGDRLIFKILNNGLNDPKNTEKARTAFERVLDGKNDPNLTERALRYDLTIPFARYVVMHQNELAFPFRRYQMQPVWRADRPQKGRYREFWQCDADVVGSNSLVNEAELLGIYREAFHRLQVPGIQVKINSRKVLAGLAECCGAAGSLTDITVAIDKLDKIGLDGVQKELVQRGLDEEKIGYITRFLSIQSEHEARAHEGRLDAMAQLLAGSETAQLGIAELRQTLAYHDQLSNASWTSDIMVDFTLARGLNYYTGLIVEVATSAVKMGSIGGGGRYDDLTGLFGLKGLSGVGISFGVDRIYDVLEELGLFPAQLASGTRIIFVNIEPRATPILFGYLNELRAAGIAAELYADSAKFDKQMKYADKRNIPFVGIVGASELEEGMINLKDMASGEQRKLAIGDLIATLATP
ncbi:histidine--tRNA ligase [Taibaiella koreensis]|uniref:histidine--tRNA ligase n=1 Tax=Taibaiella koreensis TaxID=1268548 RepID=UPI000E59D76B|nr:histidine--tRNA ligase [Taibaiella koreensis]